MSFNNGKLITIEEAADRLGVCTKTVRRYVQQSVLKSSKVFNGNKRHQIMVVEESLSGYPGIGPNKALQNLPLSRALPEKSSKKEALVQATFRIGWLEGQLDMTRKMLTEGAEATKQREELSLREKALAERKIQELEDQIVNLQTSLQKATRRYWWEFWKPKPESLKTSLACG